MPPSSLGIYLYNSSARYQVARWDAGCDFYILPLYCRFALLWAGYAQSIKQRGYVVTDFVHNNILIYCTVVKNKHAPVLCNAGT